jgi:hypothetical protein
MKIKSMFAGHEVNKKEPNFPFVGNKRDSPESGVSRMAHADRKRESGFVASSLQTEIQRPNFIGSAYFFAPVSGVICVAGAGVPAAFAAVVSVGAATAGCAASRVAFNFLMKKDSG